MAAEAMETIRIVAHGVADARSGAVFERGRDYRVPKAHADIRYQRGHARPAAEVDLEKLRALGVVGIVVAKDAEPSVRTAAAKTGVAVKNQGK